MKHIALIAAILLGSTAYAQTPDCAKPANQADKLICYDEAGCTPRNEIIPRELAAQVGEFYAGTEKSPDRKAIEEAQKIYLEKRNACGNGGNLKDAEFRFQVHECLCKTMFERFDALRFAKREFGGGQAKDFMALVRGAAKGLGGSFTVKSVFCATNPTDKAVRCEIRDDNDKYFKLGEVQARKLQSILVDIGYGSVNGGLGNQGEQVLKVKCSGGKCSWECDQVKGT